jgi:hypothetical protein
MAAIVKGCIYKQKKQREFEFTPPEIKSAADLSPMWENFQMCLVRKFSVKRHFPTYHSTKIIIFQALISINY